MRASFLRYKRLQRGLTQQALADLVGSDQPTIANYERGSRLPTDEMLAKLAEALDVRSAFLLLREVEVRGDVVFADTGEVVPR